jgi:hypothetical protein
MRVPESFELGNGVSVGILLFPMPLPDATGKYPLLQEPRPLIQVEFSRDGHPLDTCDWDCIFGNSLLLKDGTRLEAADLELVDELGWDILLKYGFWPTELLLRSD